VGPRTTTLLIVLAAVAPTPAPVRFPDPDVGVASLPARGRAQLEAARGLQVFHGFRFEDRVRQSRITFVHRAVDDVRKHYRPVHYDHGNGLAAADVDADGRPDLYFVNQVGKSGLWKNLGGGAFRDVTDDAGVGLPDRIGVTASFGDVDNDGDPDLFVTTVRGGNALFENDGRGRFRDITREAGVGLVAHSSGAVFFDYDKDGLLDLLVCNVGRYTSDAKGPDGAYRGLEDAFSGHLHPGRTEYPALYRNLGKNKFQEVSGEMGLRPRSWSGDASFADINADGWPDLYLLNMQGDNHYYENAAGRGFVDRTAHHFPKTPWGSMGIKFFDFDNDGLLDLFLTDMHSDMSEEIGPEREKLKSRMQWPPDYLQDGSRSLFGNALYRNLGGGRFEEISDRVGAENYWPWGLSVGDLNADGWDDAFITSGMGFPFRYGVNTLLLNDRGQKLVDAEFLLGVEPRREGRTHTPWFDLECTAEDRAAPQCHGRTGPVTMMTPLSSRASVMLDLEGDGDLDIVTNELNDGPMVLVSDLSGRKRIHWLNVVLEGTTSNRNGLGAVVRVHSGGRVFTKSSDGKSGYLSQSGLPLYFGLGDTTRIDRVEVAWPSGRKQVVTQELRADDTLRIAEPR
jgi:enediyne biosynthesis protein E4